MRRFIWLFRGGLKGLLRDWRRERFPPPSSLDSLRDDILSAPIPERFVKLLRELERMDSTGAASASEEKMAGTSPAIEASEDKDGCLPESIRQRIGQQLR
jgi:hypothetical protein